MTRARVPAPPAVLPAPRLHVIPAGTPLHRNHAAGFRAAEFNPCKGQPSRFAPFQDAAGQCVPTLYAATTRVGAAYESIFHDIAATARFKTVRRSVVLARAVSEIAPKRDLALAALFTPDLKAWALRREQLITTPRSTYEQTVAWAAAVHAACPGLDGLIWTSRQCDPDLCMVLFGDRVSEAAFDVLGSRTIHSDAALLLEMRSCGARAGITITG